MTVSMKKLAIVLTAFFLGSANSGLALGESKAASQSNHASRKNSSYNKSRSLDTYTPLTNPVQLVVLHHALLPGPINMDQLVSQISDRYQKSSNAFDRKEIVAALAPDFYRKLEDERSDRHYSIDLSFSDQEPELVRVLGSYDFEKKGFPVKYFNYWVTPDQAVNNLARLGDRVGASVTIVDGSDHIRTNDIRFANWQKYKFAPMSDLQRAKQIETLVTSGERLVMRIFLYARKSVVESGSALIPGNHTEADIVSVRILDSAGRTLLTY